MPGMNTQTGRENRHLSRRQWLGMLGVSGAAGLAGCVSGDGDDDDGDDTEATTDDQGTEDDQGIDQEEDVDELPEVSGTYDTVTSASFETLNPLYNTEAGAGTAIGRALDMGYTFDGNNDYFPLLYDMETDSGKVWTFTVREGLEFSDPYGEVTADSFVYQIQELHQSDWANTADTQPWAGVTVEKTGEYEFTAELQSPSLLWPKTYDPLLYPIPKDLVQPYVEEEDAEGLQQDQELLNLEFTGNLGAFVLDNWERSAGTTYSRNENYFMQEVDDAPDLFEGAPYFEGASISVVEEQSSRLGALETGEADAAAIPPERYEEFDNKDSVNVKQIPQPYNEIVSVNMRDNGWNAGPGNLFTHKEFRQGMACAISKQDLIDGVYRGLAKPHFTWQPRFSDFYPGDENVKKFGVGDQYGSEVARSKVETALDASEYDYRYDGDRLVNPSGDQVTLDIYHSAGQETERLTCEFVAQEMDRNLGIDVQVEAIDGTKFSQEYWTSTPPEEPVEAEDTDGAWNTAPSNPGPRSVHADQEWDMSMVFGLNTFPLNPLTNSVFFDGPDAFYNPVGYYPEFDAEGLWQDAREAESIDELRNTLQELFTKISEEQPYVMLLFSDDLTGYSPDLNGPIENFQNGWDLPTWHFEE